MQLVLYVPQPLDATKNVTQSINYKIKLKQSDFKWYEKKILGFERLLPKISDIEKKLPLKYIWVHVMSYLSGGQF